jgi:NADPH:quinone reductase-like Zn-dependent oxidoreductase
MAVQTTTRAFELTDYGIDKIVEGKRQVPNVGPTDVLVSMKACSLNYRDFLMAKGLYSRNLKLPLVLLSDGAGEVIEVGSAVTKFKRGDRVAPIFMQKWTAGELTADAAKSALGGAIDGVLQNEAIFHEHGLVHIPSHLSYEEAATLPCAAVTAWNGMFEQGQVGPHSSVLALGTGGVSIFALQLAKAAGAVVAITSSSDEKLERAKKLGADILVNYSKNADWEKEVMKALPEGVDHVIEVGGAGTLDRSIKAVKLGGHISLIGLLAPQGQFDATKLLMKHVRLQGIFVGSREMFERMNKAIEHHKIKPVIDKTFKVEQITEALETMASGSHFGKIVLRF